MSKNRNGQILCAKNAICDDKKFLASGPKKNNFKFVTINFFVNLKKIKYFATLRK